jgi:hypothetical protein
LRAAHGSIAPRFHGLMLFELALAMIAFCFVYLLPLTPIPRAKVLERLDVASFVLLSFGPWAASRSS